MAAPSPGSLRNTEKEGNVCQGTVKQTLVIPAKSFTITSSDDRDNPQSIVSTATITQKTEATLAQSSTIGQW